MQEKVRFYADYRIKQHAPLRLLRTRLFFLISLLQVYSQGGMVKLLLRNNTILKQPIIVYSGGYEST